MFHRHARLLPLVLLSASVAIADEVVLTDGSKIVGEIQQLSYGKLKMKTDFAGDMVIDAARVQGLTTPQNMAVQVKNGERHVGPMTYDGAGQAVASGDGARVVAIDQVVAIWPAGSEAPEETEARLKRESQGWKFRLEFGINGETGNSENLNINGAAIAKRETDRDRLSLYASGRYQKDNGNDTAREVIGGIRLEVDLNDRLYLWGNGELENDQFENIDLRATVAGGLGYFVIRKPEQEFKIFAGPGYQHESYSDDTESRDQIIAVIGETYYHEIAPWLTFTHGITYFPTLEDINDYRIVMENAGEIPISSDGQWKLRLGVKNQYKSQPADGIEKLDTFYFLNLVMDFK